jgi:hypothetical protein
LQHQGPEAQRRVHTRSVRAGGGLPAAALGRVASVALVRARGPADHGPQASLCSLDVAHRARGRNAGSVCIPMAHRGGRSPF